MKRIIGVVLLIVMMVSCSPRPAEVIPTLIPSLQPAVAATNTSEPTAAVTQIQNERPTLPPTWTPSPEPTETSIPPTQTPLPEVTAIPTLVACGPFDVDREKSASTFKAGQPTQVFWVPVKGAVRYRIGVLDGTNQEIFMDYAVDATYTFKSDLFEKGKLYAWKVYPEDSLGRQMCLAVTGDMSPG